ncbi:2-hydroxyacid dehydrogenase [Paraburkholderia tropica]|uniref:2-hydroxyacid dehydrogenase n=1 Tax=Paraburkholderia tropica TaxID=92647 RepID=UPI0015916C90|nr:2-hydroxyacid dehydrogenase [Paraburkholderia tropica]
MAREKVLKIGVFAEELQSRIDEEFECLSEEEALKSTETRAQIRAIITRSNYRVSSEIIELFPNLRIIATSGVGYDGISLSAARDRGIVVTNTPGVLDSAVCELAIGLLFALLRRIPAMDAHVRSGNWKNGAFALTTGLNGKRVGIVGLGRIGRRIAELLTPFDVELAYCGGERQSVPYEYFTNAQELAEHVDILILSCPGGASTHHLINDDVLQKLGPNGFLVNVARGTVVDEAALIRALKNRTIRGAALDVFETEPLVDSPLISFDNVVLTPHAGSATEETRQIMLRLMLDNVHRVLIGENALTPVK